MFLYGKQHLHMQKCNFLCQMMHNRLSTIKVFITVMVNLWDCLLLLGTIDKTVFNSSDNPMK